MPADEQPNPSIAERIVNGPSGIDQALDQGGGDGGEQSPVEAPKPLDAAGVEALLAERLKPLEDSLAEKDVELAYLRGAQAEQRQQPRVVERAAPVEKPKSYLESTPEAQVLEGLEKKPIETLARIIDDRLKPILDKLDGVNGTVTRTQQEREFQNLIQQDKDELVQDFGYLKDNAEFRKESDILFQTLLRANNGQYLPGMLHKSASKVHAIMSREGKLSDTRGNGNGSSQEIISPSRAFRNGNSHGAENSSGAGGGGEGGGGDPKTYADLQRDGILSAIDVAAAKRVNTRLGVAEADYVRRLALGRKSDKNFGER
jgi:hypothetical protein